MILVGRRSIEDPRTSLSDWPDDDGTFADTGQRIGRREALKYSPVYRAVSLVSSTIAKIPCRVHARTASGKRRATDHPSYNLLRYKPNDEQTAFYFFQTMLGHCLLEPGNAYAYVFRDDRGAASDLILLDPKAVTPTRENGAMVYVYHDPCGGGMRRLDASSVLHWRGPGWDGLCGYSVLEYARNSIAMGSGAQKYSNTYFANNAEPRVVLEFPQWLKQDQAKQIKASWEGMHKGLNNAHRTAILQGGMKANTISLSARDSQLIETMEFSIKEVANWFGVPPHKIGSDARTAYNSLEQENQSFLDDTIDPWLVMIEQECRDKLLTEAQKANDTHVIEFDRSALVRANLSARGEYYAKGLSGHPWLVVDEVRNAENLNGVGITSIQPPTNNFAQGDPDAEAVDVQAEDGGTDARIDDAITAARAAFDDVRSRMGKRLDYNIKKALQKSSTKDGAGIIGEVYDKHVDVMRSALAPTATTVSALTGEAPDTIVSDTLAGIRARIEKQLHEATQ